MGGVDHHFPTTEAPVKENDRSMLPYCRGVEKPRDSIFGWLSPNNNLIGIAHHPYCWLVVDELLCTERKAICKLKAANLVSSGAGQALKTLPLNKLLQTSQCSITSYDSTTGKQKEQRKFHHPDVLFHGFADNHSKELGYLSAQMVIDNKGHIHR
jgi:hypothetical protein